MSLFSQLSVHSIRYSTAQRSTHFSCSNHAPMDSDWVSADTETWTRECKSGNAQGESAAHTRFYPGDGGGFLIPKESTLKEGEERKNRKTKEEEEEHLPFISIAYFASSLSFNIETTCQRQSTWDIATVSFICLYWLVVYSIYISYLSCLNMLCQQFEIQNLNYVGSGVGGSHTECMETTHYDQVAIQHIWTYIALLILYHSTQRTISVQTRMPSSLLYTLPPPLTLNFRPPLTPLHLNFSPWWITLSLY
jgi:hypothetical protein